MQLPALQADIEAALRQSIRDHGVIVPVVYNRVDALGKKVAKRGTAVTFEGEIRALADLTRTNNSKACIQLLAQQYNRRRSVTRV